MAATGLTDATPLSQFANSLPLGDQPASDLFNLAGISDNSTLSQAATTFASGATVEQFADAANLGQGTVDQLLTARGPVPHRRPGCADRRVCVGLPRPDRPRD